MPKTLPPTLRERNRYMTFEARSDSSLERKDVVSAIWHALIRTHGEIGASETSLWVMDWDKTKSRGVIKTNHKAADKVRSALAVVTEVERKPALFCVLHTSGTLKTAREFM